MSIQDYISEQRDKRKIQKLINEGVITPEELENADIVEVEDEQAD